MLTARAEEKSSIQKEGAAKSLVQAAEEGNLELVKKLIAQGADVNASAGDKPWAPLIAAACAGHTQVVKLLLENGSKVNAGDPYGYTPLHYAIWCDDEEAVRMLVAAGADINRRTSEQNEYNAFFEAVWNGHKGIIKTFIDAGANVNYKDAYGYTPLHYAVVGNNTEVAMLFVGTGVSIPDFHRAAFEGNLAKVTDFVESGMDVDTKDKVGWTPTYWALSTGHKEVFKYLLSQGAETTAKTSRGRTLLHQASQAGFLEMVKLLIAEGADVNVTANNGQHPLGDAAVNGHEDIVKLLIASGAKVNLTAAGKGTALHAAAFRGHSTILDFLIANGADVNVNARNGTPLHFAADAGIRVEDKRCAEMVEKLLAQGADVHAKESRWGRTPLHGAAYKGRYKTAGLLIAAGANVNATDNEGKTPLSLAQEKGRTEIVELLRKHGAKE